MVKRHRKLSYTNRLTVLTAESKEVLGAPPKLMMATEGADDAWNWLYAQSIPEIISEYDPLPLSERTLTATMVADVAIPIEGQISAIILRHEFQQIFQYRKCRKPRDR